MAGTSAIGLTFDFTGGNDPTSGVAGNNLVFTVDGVSVRVTGWDRNTVAEWHPAYVGQYSRGLGITNTGADNSHTIDNTPENTGWDEYLLLEFSQAVELSEIYLGYVGSDSDLSLWMANPLDPFNNSLDLADSGDRGLFQFVENDLVSHGDPRVVSVNDNWLSGTAWIVNPTTAWRVDGNDSFKVSSLTMGKTDETRVTDTGATAAMLAITLAFIAVVRRTLRADA